MIFFNLSTLEHLSHESRNESAHLDVSEQDLWVVVDVVADEELGHVAQQADLGHGEQVGQMYHLRVHVLRHITINIHNGRCIATQTSATRDQLCIH